MATVDAQARADIAELRRKIAVLERRATPALTLAPGHGFARVLRVVAEEFGTTRNDLLGEKRTPDRVLPRQVAMALADRCLGYSRGRIGQLIGRDHTTVLHGVRRVAQLAAQDPDFAARLDRLAESIQQKGDDA